MTMQNEIKYVVYALNEDGDLYQLEFVSATKKLAQFFARGLDVIRDPYIVQFYSDEIAPNTMEIE